MEKLIPIIFALIWLGFKLYQKSTKESPKSNVGSQEPNSSFEEILKSLYAEPRKPIEPVEVQNEYKSVKTLQNDSKKTKADNLESIEYADAQHGKAKKHENIQTKETKEKPDIIDVNFSLRQAIINQAILDRPYK